MPANVKYFLQLLEEISNFKISKLSWDCTFGAKEMVFSFVLYFLILGIFLVSSKKWPEVLKIKRVFIWSPLFRCIMMTWFATALWTFTWFHSANDGFKTEETSRG